VALSRHPSEKLVGSGLSKGASVVSPHNKSNTSRIATVEIRQGGGIPCGNYLGRKAERLIQLTNLIFSHNTLEILCFAFDAIPNTPVRLDREASNNSVDGSFAIIGAPLWSLSLMMYIVIY
jgi:hypothetical protein